MLTILICALGGTILAAIIASKDTYRDASDVILGGILVISGILTGAIIGVMLALVLNFNAPKEFDGWVKTSETKLIAFNDGSSVQGSFFLGCGSIEGKSVYLYYTQDSDGGIRQGRESAKASVIYEQDRKGGIMKTYRHKVIIKKSWQRWVLINSYVHEAQYKFFVPKGTVIRKFKADLQ